MTETRQRQAFYERVFCAAVTGLLAAENTEGRDGHANQALCHRASQIADLAVAQHAKVRPRPPARLPAGPEPDAA